MPIQTGQMFVNRGRFCGLLALCLLVTIPGWAVAQGRGRGQSHTAVQAGIQTSVRASAQPGVQAGGQASATLGTNVRLETVSFLYKADEMARYLDLKSAWQDQHPTVPPLLADLAELAMLAHQQAQQERPFTEWRQQGGPNPWVFQPVIHVRNTSNRTAQLDVNILVTVEVNLGEWKVDPRTLLTNYAHLKKTARWQAVQQQMIHLPVLAPSEEALARSQPVALLPILEKYPHQWPDQLRVQATLQTSGQSANGKQTQLLRLVPDHFVVPLFLY
ncbi:MAG: hypothetical protein SFZ03_10010 [Candidatus Melainabacteria bacterium]|nr:hypothetical protein [Candidatus Melainabacteria bacterium]